MKEVAPLCFLGGGVCGCGGGEWLSRGEKRASKTKRGCLQRSRQETQVSQDSPQSLLLGRSTGPHQIGPDSPTEPRQPACYTHLYSFVCMCFYYYFSIALSSSNIVCFFGVREIVYSSSFSFFTWQHFDLMEYLWPVLLFVIHSCLQINWVYCSDERNMDSIQISCSVAKETKPTFFNIIK